MKRVSVVLLLCALGVTAGCGSTKNPLLTSGKDLLQSIGGAKASPVTASSIKQNLTPEVLAQIKGPIILAELPSRNAAAALVLSGSNGPVRTFVSPDGLSLSFEKGMLINSRGLGNDLMSADVEAPLAAVTAQRPAARAIRIHRYIDGENQTVTRSFVCRYTRTGTHVIETCNSTDLQIENKYVLNSASRIRNSKQWISPTAGYVIIQSIRN